jgi:hypothetical protein
MAMNAYAPARNSSITRAGRLLAVPRTLGTVIWLAQKPDVHSPTKGNP